MALVLGSYLAAIVVYARLTGRKPGDITPVPALSLLVSPRPTPATVDTIGAAAEAVSAPPPHSEPLLQ